MNVNLVMGIETSCDETAAAVVEAGRRILSSVVASQVELHERFGGVVPEIASRRHVEAIVPTVRRALAEAGCDLADVDAFAVTNRPGLVGSLLVGVSAAKAYALALDRPLIGIHHIEGHIYSHFLAGSPAGKWRAPARTPVARPGAASSLAGEWRAPARTPMERLGAEAPTWPGAYPPPTGPGGYPLSDPPPQAQGRPPGFPFLVLVASGGHSELILMEGHGRYRCLGRTRDDAAGEAFDKVARTLGFGLPGGPALDRAAAQWPGEPHPLPSADLSPSYDFSFSGLKTAAVRAAAALSPSQLEACRGAIARGFQEAAVTSLVRNVRRAVEDLGVGRVGVAGGVAANSLLRAELSRMARDLGCTLYVPPPELCTDNAAMIAAAGYYRLSRGESDGLDLDTFATCPLVSSGTCE